MLRHLKKILATGLVTVTLLSACTPEQIEVLRQTSHVSETDAEALVALPDAPMRLPDGRVVAPDGKVSKKTPQQVVNSLPYSHNYAEPALEAWRIVMRHRGHSEAEIKAWQPFITDVIWLESGYCWNVRRGVVMANGGKNCAIKRQGKHSDSGFGQLISIHHGKGKWLCVEEKICGANGVIASPWNSMVSLVALWERGGSQPWCFNARARRYHNCTLAPDR